MTVLVADLATLTNLIEPLTQTSGNFNGTQRAKKKKKNHIQLHST